METSSANVKARKRAVGLMIIGLLLLILGIIIFLLAKKHERPIHMLGAGAGLILLGWGDWRELEDREKRPLATGRAKRISWRQIILSLIIGLCIASQGFTSPADTLYRIYYISLGMLFSLSLTWEYWSRGSKDQSSS